MTWAPLSNSEGQGHQAALLTALLARQAVVAVGGERVGREKLLLRCRPLGGARRFGAHGAGEGRGHIVAAARLQLVTRATLRVSTVLATTTWLAGWMSHAGIVSIPLNLC